MFTDDLQVSGDFLIDYRRTPNPCGRSSVLQGERRFCIRSTDDRIAMMDAVAEINNEDRHEMVQRLIKSEILSILRSDVTQVIPTQPLIQMVEDIFS